MLAQTHVSIFGADRSLLIQQTPAQNDIDLANFWTVDRLTVFRTCVLPSCTFVLTLAWFHISRHFSPPLALVETDFFHGARSPANQWWFCKCPWLPIVFDVVFCTNFCHLSWCFVRDPTHAGSQWTTLCQPTRPCPFPRRKAMPFCRQRRLSSGSNSARTKARETYKVSQGLLGSIWYLWEM